MSWTDVRDAIQVAITSASGLSSGQVIWKFQNANAPSLDYIAMSLSGVQVLGIDYIKSSTDLTRSAGQEIKLEVTGSREVGLELEFFTASTADASDALALAEKTKSGLMLPSIRDTLYAAHVTPFDPGPISYVPDVIAVGFRGRSTCTVRCYVPAQAVFEYTGYIAQIQGTLTANGGQIDPETRTLLLP